MTNTVEYTSYALNTVESGTVVYTSVAPYTFERDLFIVKSLEHRRCNACAIFAFDISIPRENKLAFLLSLISMFRQDSCDHLSCLELGEFLQKRSNRGYPQVDDRAVLRF